MKRNVYRDLVNMISQDMFQNELYLPIFGYSAKTFKDSSEPSHLFPLSMNMSNPLLPNQEEALDEAYTNCLKKIKLDLPVKVQPVLNFLKTLASHSRDK
jgi:hypothetical protein